MNAMNLIKQLMSSGNPSAMINNMAKTNPKIAQAMPIVQQIMSEGGTKREQLQKACKKANVDSSKVENEIKNLGINID